MTPNALQDRASAMTELYGEAELRMIRAIAKRVSSGKAVSNWQQKKLEEVTQMKQELQGIVSGLKSGSRMTREILMREAYESGWKDSDNALGNIYRGDGRSFSTIPPARFDATSELMKELDSRFDALDSEILRDANDAYRSIIGNVVALQSTGIMSTREAVKEALSNFADRGIAGFVDRAGRRWEMDSYANMAVRTGMMRASLQGLRDDMAAHGEHLVIITDHMDTCPLCRDWERKVLAVDSEGAKDIECEGLLSDAETAGLFHPNCLHAMTPYVPFLTDKEGMKAAKGYSAAQDAEGYRNRQVQRYMERNVRRWKRQQAAATDPERERYCKAQVDRWQARLRQHVEDTGIPRQYWREGGRVKLSDAAKKLKPQSLTPFVENAKIEKELQKPLTLAERLQQIRDKGNLTTDRLIEAGGYIWEEYEKRLKDVNTMSDYDERVKAFNARNDEYNKLFIDQTDALIKYRELRKKYGADDPRTISEYQRYVDLTAKITAEHAILVSDREKLVSMRRNRGTETADILKGLLSEHREVTGIDVKQAMKEIFTRNGRKFKGAEELTKALNYYPREWTKAITQYGGLKGSMKDARAFVRGHEIQVDGYFSTSMHELAHIMEDAVAHTLSDEQAFYAMRTAGLDLEWMGPGYGKTEMTRRDDFVNPYMGKDYGGRGFELMSMGYQYLYTDPHKLDKDEQMRKWLLGILFLR